MSVCAPTGLRQRATTLIELLVVIALIGMLVTTLIPSLKRSMRMASATVCMHNLREVGQCLQLYRYDNDGWLPVAEKPVPEPDGVREPDPWFAALFPTYLNDPLILTCPEDPFRYRMLKVTGQLDSSKIVNYASYGINGFIMTAGEGFLADLDRQQPSRPHDTILLADIGPDDVFGPSKSSGMVGPVRNNSLLAWDDGFDPFSGQDARTWLTVRHGRGINVLTLTGGVREARTADIIEQPMYRYYESCAASGCTFCNEFRYFHYSFARDRLFWWTGPKPSE